MMISKLITAMGAGVSASKGGEPSPSDIAKLGQPERRAPQELLVYVMPMVDELKKRSAICQLEVGTTGFRLLRPGTSDSLGMFPWGQIHSWAHTDFRFTFRFFDDNKRVVLLYTLCLRDVDVLLSHIKEVIETILAARKTSAATDEQYAVLLKSISSCQEGAQLDLLLLALSKSFLWAKQGRELLELMPTNFDKVEAATQLHGRLVDQNRFSYLLEALDCQADSDNVWARITMLKKQQGTRKAKSIITAEPVPAASTISSRVIVHPVVPASGPVIAAQVMSRPQAAEASSKKETPVVAVETEASAAVPKSEWVEVASETASAAATMQLVPGQEDAVARLSVPGEQLPVEKVEGMLSALSV